MSLRVSGKSVDIGDAFRGHVESRIGDALDKYFDGGFTGHVTVEREGHGYKTDCAIHLDTGIVLKSEGRAPDIHQSFDIAADRIDKRLRRYKRRLKEHHHRKNESAPAIEYVLANLDEAAESQAEGDPVVIAEQVTSLETMTVGGAVMTLDLTDSSVVVFRNAGHGGINVVYRRSDGHIGWIDPTLNKQPGGTRQ
jgi:ribosomal subunit interface protein